MKKVEKHKIKKSNKYFPFILEQLEQCKKISNSATFIIRQNFFFNNKKAKELFNFGEEVIEIKNPLSEDMAIMRPTLLYSLITNVRDNINRNQTDLKLFEISKTFKKLLLYLAFNTSKIVIAFNFLEIIESFLPRIPKVKNAVGT